MKTIFDASDTIMVDELGEELGRPRRRKRIIRRPKARRRFRRRPVARRRPVIRRRRPRPQRPIRMMGLVGRPRALSSKAIRMHRQTQADLTKLILPVGLVAGGLLLLSKLKR